MILNQSQKLPASSRSRTSGRCRELGAALPEYVVLIGYCAVTMLIAVPYLGNSTSKSYESAATELSAKTPAGSDISIIPSESENVLPVSDDPLSTACTPEDLAAVAQYDINQNNIIDPDELGLYGNDYLPGVDPPQLANVFNDCWNAKTEKVTQPQAQLD